MDERSTLEFAGRLVPPVEVLVNTARALASMRLALTPAPERIQVADVDAAFHLGRAAMLIRSDVHRAA